MNSYKHRCASASAARSAPVKPLCWKLCVKRCAIRQLAVVTNDIYTKEDQRILTEARWRLNASSVWKPAAARIRRSAKMPQ